MKGLHNSKSTWKRGNCMLETMSWEKKGKGESTSTYDEWKSWRKMDGLQQRQEKEISEENPPRDSCQSWTQSTDPRGNDSESDWETVRAVGLCMGFWGKDLADSPEKWVAMGFKCGRVYMKRHFWSLSEDKNWKRTWNVPFCIECQIADRERTIKTAQGSPSAAYNGNRIFFFPGCQPSHSGETKRISST